MITHKRPGLLSGLAAVILVLLASALPWRVSAATVGGNGMKVSPVSTNLVINPGDTKTVQIYVQNVTKQHAEYQVVVNDFTSNSEDGAPALLLNQGEFAPAHSLKRFIAPIGDVSLAAGEEKAVNVIITIPKGTSGGGYYAAIRFAPADVNQSNNVTLSSSVASLILVRVPGNFKEQLNLASIEIREGDNGTPSSLFTTNKNLLVVARFQNMGDVQEQPFGSFLLKQDKKSLATYKINTGTPPGNVLPGSIRRFTAKLDHLGVIGKYTVYGNFGYGKDGQLLSGQTTFYIVPLPLILGGLAVIGIIAFFIFGFPKLKRQYDRNVVRRSRR